MDRVIKKKAYANLFNKVASGEKTFDLRLADWDCRQGDILELVEIDDATRRPTGKSLRFRVGYTGKTKDMASWWTKEEVQQYGFQVISLLKEDTLPQIRIKDAWLLRENASRYLHELWGKDKELADDDWVKWKVGEYTNAWQPLEKKILLAMTDTLGLSFRQNIIDVYIAPWFYAFSDPMVIGVIHEPDAFVDILTHELLHRLLTDNTSAPPDANFIKEWQKLFGSKHSFNTLVHIPVHAAHKAIYFDVLNEPERLERDISKCKENDAAAYVKAWDYVEEHGYKQINEQLKESYKKLRTKK